MPMPCDDRSTSMPIFLLNSPLPSGSMNTLLISCDFAHWNMTKASLTARQITVSTPRSLNASYLDSYPGRWTSEHAGVNAPGTANKTTFFPSKISCGSPCPREPRHWSTSTKDKLGCRSYLFHLSTSLNGILSCKEMPVRQSHFTDFVIFITFFFP